MNTAMQNGKVIVASVEAGGTTFVVAVAELVPSGAAKILYRHEVDSSRGRPQETLSECAAFFKKYKPADGYSALGIASFGPVGLDPSKSDTYGCILGSSPKESWRNVNLLSPLAKACRGKVPLAVKVETDVNAPALAEYLQQDGKLSSVAYVTVGTGVGVGLVVNNKTVHGRMHPEGGHVPVVPLEGDSFPGYSWGGKSPFGGHSTVEGLTSSVALTERLEKMQGGKKLSRNCLVDLPDDHEVWEHSANALANLCVTLLLTTSVELIVLGGGIMKRKGLLEKVQRKVVVLLNGYLELPDDLSELIRQSSYGNDIGIMGAIVLAKHAISEGRPEIASGSDGNPAFRMGFLHGFVAGVMLALVGGILGRRKIYR